jgi:plasmid stability protein
MATLTVRRLDDRVYDVLRSRAEHNGRSLEAEVRAILEDAATPRQRLVERLRAFHAEVEGRHGILSDSTPIIRQMRDEE